MATEALIEMLQKQLQIQEEQLQIQEENHKKQLDVVQQNASNSDNSVYDRNSTVVSLPKFTSFDPNVELCKEY